ncbi:MULTISPECIES: DUF1127 domain-containing protein [Phyllobacterium]|jgi:uncharacterized protein YjiS (DUF1127 family)|uniref:Uncharacterized protein n=1 Tax=Phyllobacterium sophorae TaxID=1520277 RepID=A0A2P7ATP8_9HYPH|nr:MULTISPECIES: DUF1127 domain-containing protein [Phyllobacterium]PSH57580.1 hypothetical protein CU103_27745 [Phyllobacterium sophorae]UXN63497.1 DUF1127 domain-containing protein [Phyllobacterium sp. A18/5-2]
MSIVPVLTKFLQAWRTAGQEREVLLALLNKHDDHLLRDAGMTRQEVINIVCGYHLRSLLPRLHPIGGRFGIVDTTSGNEVTKFVKKPASLMD